MSAKLRRHEKYDGRNFSYRPAKHGVISVVFRKDNLFHRRFFLEHFHIQQILLRLLVLEFKDVFTKKIERQFLVIYLFGSEIIL